MLQYLITNCLLFPEYIIDEDQFDIDPVDQRDDRCYDTVQLEGFRYEIEFQLNSLLDTKCEHELDKAGYCCVLGFASEWLDTSFVTPYREGPWEIPIAPKCIMSGETWDETMGAVDAYFGANPQCGAKTLEEYERQTREFREEQKKLDRAIAHLRIDEEWEEAKRLERKCREMAEPVRPGFHRLDAFTGDPVERAIDFGTVYSRERLLLEVTFEDWPLVNSAQVAGR
ncbi:hypothetical protein BMG03_19235 (plasmid) [Thioclava nitratireducens]|uniref:Uncharacterized protein n=1 Tax=Thioclava nitratireducens TaxID=1915078 RepID=A0ABN4XD49_9RHOB|nr:hypothetical protein [Thioclava nitratireducens]AQS50060.1 hypothetical protein BMG03_19235 [Thioclava nitratireducens]